jgi:hypothetical protein
MSRSIETTLISLTLLCAVHVVAATPDKGALKPAWEWTDEERIAARVAAVAPGEGTVVHGTEHPEWFLPTELMNTLLGVLTRPAASADLTRDMLKPRFEQAGIDEREFWAAFTLCAGEYKTLDARRWKILRAAGQAGTADHRRLQTEAERLGREECALRVQVLADARRTFGRENFDRILYAVVAPTLSTNYAPSGDAAATLRYVEAGCSR